MSKEKLSKESEEVIRKALLLDTEWLCHYLGVESFKLSKKTKDKTVRLVLACLELANYKDEQNKKITKLRRKVE